MEIDFLPREYVSRRATSRDQWYLLGIGAVALVLLLGSMLNQSQHTEALRAQLAQLKQEYEGVRGQGDQAEKLEARKRELEFDAEAYSLLHAHPSLSRVLYAISSSCPPELNLEEISYRTDKQGLSGSGTSRSPSAEPPDIPEEILRLSELEQLANERRQAEYRLQIKGSAATLQEVTALVERLRESECFREVQFKTQEAKSRFVDVRSFTIDCLLRNPAGWRG